MPLLFLNCKWPTSGSVWVESWKTLCESPVLPFRGTGGIAQKVNTLGMQDRDAMLAFITHMWPAQPYGPGGGMAARPGVGSPEQEVHLLTAGFEGAQDKLPTHSFLPLQVSPGKCRKRYYDHFAAGKVEAQSS